MDKTQYSFEKKNNNFNNYYYSRNNSNISTANSILENLSTQKKSKG